MGIQDKSYLCAFVPPRENSYWVAGLARFSRLICFICVVAICGLSGGCVSSLSPGNAARVWVSKSGSFPIAKSDKSHNWGFVSHPSIADYGKYGILVGYTLGGDKTPGSQQVPAELAEKGPAFTQDGGENWTYGKTWTESVPYWREGLPLSRKAKCGERMYSCVESFYSTKVSGCYTGSGVWINNDESVTGPFSNRWFVGSHVKGYVSSQGLCLDDGTILFAGYMQRSAKDSKYDTLLFSSRDGGMTFEHSIIATPEDAPWGNEGPCEPALLKCENGDMICVMRTGSKMIRWGDPVIGTENLLARSSDGGKTWTYQKMTTAGMRPKLYRMSNGVIVMCFGRPGNNMVFSADDGYTWGNEVALTPSDVKTSGYCDVIEVAPDKLLAVYDMFDTDANGIWLWEPEEVNGVFGRYVTVKRLW